MFEYGPASGVQPGGDIFVVKITGVGSADADGFVPHAWTEQCLKNGSAAYTDNELGRKGTTSSRQAYPLNSGESLMVGDVVFLRLRGRINLPVFEDVVYDVVGTTALGAQACTPFIQSINFANCTYVVKYLRGRFTVSDTAC